MTIVTNVINVVSFIRYLNYNAIYSSAGIIFIHYFLTMAFHYLEIFIVIF